MAEHSHFASGVSQLGLGGYLPPYNSNVVRADRLAPFTSGAVIQIPGYTPGVDIYMTLLQCSSNITVAGANVAMAVPMDSAPAKQINTGSQISANVVYSSSANTRLVAGTADCLVSIGAYAALSGSSTDSSSRTLFLRKNGTTVLTAHVAVEQTDVTYHNVNCVDYAVNASDYYELCVQQSSSGNATLVSPCRFWIGQHVG
jgi:hypothetical protein